MRRIRETGRMGSWHPSGRGLQPRRQDTPRPVAEGRPTDPDRLARRFNGAAGWRDGDLEERIGCRRALDPCVAVARRAATAGDGRRGDPSHPHTAIGHGTDSGRPTGRFCGGDALGTRQQPRPPGLGGRTSRRLECFLRRVDRGGEADAPAQARRNASRRVVTRRDPVPHVCGVLAGPRRCLECGDGRGAQLHPCPRPQYIVERDMVAGRPLDRDRRRRHSPDRTRLRQDRPRDRARGTTLSLLCCPSPRRALVRSSDCRAALRRIWDLESGSEPLVLRGHEDRVHWGVWSADGAQVLTISDDATARVWNTMDGGLLSTFRGHDGPVHYARWSGDERLILTCSSDHSARIWDARSGSPIVKIGGIDDPVEAAEWHPLRHRLLVRTASGAWIWNINLAVERLLTKARDRVSRRLAPQERRSYGLPAAR